MENLRATITSGLTERYGTLASRVRELAAPLTEEQFWQKPFPFGNSFGHLVLHLTGNLNYYIGAQMAETGYVRDRDREFTETRHLPKEEVLKSFDEAIEMVLRAARAQSAEDWSESYSAVGAGNVGSRFHMVLKCAAHLDHHVGQMIYLCFELSRPQAQHGFH
ncbi:MAG TPA: DinB family protein [Terriglobales bacterium]|nr:DinB family protein [Terriglobales bacterium]